MSKICVIAEAGVNHNGELSLAKELIDIASESGADIVKFQTFIASELATIDAKKAEYQAISNKDDETQLSMISKLELKYEWHEELIKYSKQKNIKFLSTAFDIPSLLFINSFDPELIKIPSGEITNLPYLRKVAGFQKTTLLSTGMSTLDEISKSVDVLINSGLQKKDLVILQCTTDYPTPISDLNLNIIPMLRNHFDTNIGFSDHSLGITAPIAAAALGASVIEKHFTIDKKMIGPDHKASLDPHELSLMVSHIRDVELAMGSNVKKPSKTEIINQSIARKSVVAKVDIQKGEILSELNLTCKRPGNGISPMKWDELIGKPAIRKFNSDELIEV